MPQVKPIPEGMRTVTPHLVCAGAGDALEFYQKAFDAVETSRIPGPDGKIMHASVVEDADASFERAIAAGATVKHPMEDAFWGDRYGVLQDPFGHLWSIAAHVREVTPDEIRQAMQKMGG